MASPKLVSGMLIDSNNMWKIERRSDGAVVVCVSSPDTGGRAIPDAVFAFRQGDPQYIYWDEQLRNQECRGRACGLDQFPA